jgi:hypothetical protein
MEISKFKFPEFSNISMASFINVPLLTILLGLFFVIYIIISAVLIYHWKAYGMKSRGVLLAESLFLFVSLVLFVVSITSLYYL